MSEPTIEIRISSQTEADKIASPMDPPKKNLRGAAVSEPEITVHKIGYYQPVFVVGTDDQGRTQVICPTCRDTATVMEDGRVVCPLDEAIKAKLAEAFGDLGGQQ